MQFYVIVCGVFALANVGNDFIRKVWNPLPVFASAIDHIVFFCADNQVIRVNAKPVVALVHHIVVNRRLMACVQHDGNTMSSSKFFADPHVSIFIAN